MVAERPAAGAPGASGPGGNRAAVLAELGRHESGLDARRLHAALWDSGGARISLTTVYRILRRLADEDLVTVIRTESGDPLYRPVAIGRYFLLCRVCGRAEPFTAPEVEHRLRRIAREHGFGELRYRLGLHGVCPRCAA